MKRPNVPESARRAWEKLQVSGMSLLLVMLIFIVFVVPLITEPGEFRRLVYDIAFTLVLAAASMAVFDRRPVPLITACLCALAVALRWMEWLYPPAVATLVREGSSLAAVALLALVIGYRAFSSGVVTVDRVMGAVALYLLFGFAWASAYDIVAWRIPGAFAGNGIQGTDADRWVYFSFMTMTTAGYGDIVPVAEPARASAVLQALVGQLYPAIVLARLVSLQMSGGKAAGSAPVHGRTGPALVSPFAVRRRKWPSHRGSARSVLPILSPRKDRPVARTGRKSRLAPVASRGPSRRSLVGMLLNRARLSRASRAHSAASRDAARGDRGRA